MSITRTIKTGVLAASFVVMGAFTASADIIWDQSPDGTGAASVGIAWTNVSTGQNFAEIVSFDQSGTLTGMDIFSSDYRGTVGQSVTIRIWADDAGTPGALLTSLVTEILTIDTEATTSAATTTRKYAEFEYAFAAGSFFIGMSGTDENLNQMGLDSVYDDQMAQFSGETFSHMASVTGDMAFRLHGTFGDVDVPEPAPLALLGLGLVGLGMVRKRKA